MHPSPHITHLLADQHHRDLRRDAEPRQRARDLRREAASGPAPRRKRLLVLPVPRAFKPEV